MIVLSGLTTKTLRTEELSAGVLTLGSPEVLAGSIRMRVNGVESDLLTGQKATVSAGTPHVWWNPSDQEARVLVDLLPALRSEEFFETFFGLAQDGKVDQKTGLPSLLVMALVLREFRDEICLAQPPIAVQRVLFGVLGSVGRMRGYQGVYPYPY